MVGYLSCTTLPPVLRMYLYKAFGSIYGVKFDEAKVEDLNSFRTFNQFFTRQLKEEVRPIEEPNDATQLVSPCDGRVLSHGEVDSATCTMDCIKGNAYRLDEFLFGF